MNNRRLVSRTLGLLSLVFVWQCENAVAAETICTTQECFQKQAAICEPAIYDAQAAGGQARYKVYGPAKKANGCYIDFEFLKHPDASLLGSFFSFIIQTERALEPQLKAGVTECLQGRNGTYSCSGELFDQLGGGKKAQIRMATGPVCGDVVEDNGESLYALPKDGLWGYVTRDGSWAIPPQWSRAEPFSEGLAAVSVGGAFGIIDREGNYVLEPLLASIRPFSEGCAAAEHFHERSRYLFVSRDGSFWHYDASPEGASAEGFLGFGDFSEGKAWFKVMDFGPEKNVFGWIDTTGKIVIPRQYSGAGNFVDGLAPAAQGGDYWAYMDETGEPRLPDRWKFQKMLPFSEGLAAVRINVFTWLYMSPDGIAVEKITFKNPGRARKGPPGEADDIAEAGSFHDGLAAVKPRWALDDEEVIFIRPDGSEAFAPTRDFDLTLYCAMGQLPEFRNRLVRLLVSNSGKQCSNTESTMQSRPYYDDAHYVYLDTDGNKVIEQPWGDGDTGVTP
jgi:hypothetical protein